MRLSYKWLCELIPGLAKTDPLELAQQLTMSGLEVESVLDYGKKFSGIVVGELVKKDKHPNADKLSLCEVSTGTQKFQVVCGAPNVTAGKKYPFATLGTVMPGGLEIRPIKLRGVESFGMLCSAKELELEHDQDGLLELPPQSVVGAPVHETLGLDDCIFELNVTPNRGDALSHWGVARDVVALTGLKPDFDVMVPDGVGLDMNRAQKWTAEGQEVDLKISLEAPQACPRYTGSQIFNVKVAPSPCWLARRLVSLGVRSINNIVDATNYVMLLTGHPVHAFDAADIAGHHIRIYQLDAPQKFKTLDAAERSLVAGDLVIADAKGPVALAGIMGGGNSEVKDSTKNLILEVASFEPQQISRTSRRLGLQSESSYRFARFVSPDSVFQAHLLLRDLILALAGGEASEILDSYPKVFQVTKILLKPSEIQRILGVKVPEDEVLRVLRGLDCELSVQKEAYEVLVPSCRSDLTRPVDLIEEIVRLRGMDQIPAEMPSFVLRSTVEPAGSCLERVIKEFFVSAGFRETLHYSFGDPGLFKSVFPQGRDFLSLKNPLSEDLSAMRQSLLPQLLQCYKKNHLKQESGLRFFECRSIYPLDERGQVRERKVLAGLYGGPLWGRNRFGLKRETDFFDGRGLLDSFFKQARINVDCREDSSWPFHPGQCVLYKSDGETVAQLGALHPELLQSFKIAECLYYFVMEFEFVAGRYQKSALRYVPFAMLPPVYRDLALVAPRELKNEAILQAIEAEKPPELKSVELFDLYEGEPLPAGKKSLAYSLTYEPQRESLTDEAVNAMHFSLVEKIKTRLGVDLR